MGYSMDNPKYDVDVQLTGNDGNAFAIMASVCSALSKAGAPKEDVNQYIEESKAGDYDQLLQTAMRWVNVF